MPPKRARWTRDFRVRRLIAKGCWGREDYVCSSIDRSTERESRRSSTYGYLKGKSRGFSLVLSYRLILSYRLTHEARLAKSVSAEFFADISFGTCRKSYPSGLDSFLNSPFF
jgi:hypothetical protein